MHVLVIGAGGREHALCWKLARSPRVSKLTAAPGNPGIAAIAACVPLDPADHAAITDWCRAQSVDLAVVGPEAPLVAGLADALAAAGIPVFGPSAAAAALEGSKGFTKDLCAEAGIPTAAYRRCHSAAEAHAYLATVGAPIVVKADGIAAGKGVVVAETLEEAAAAIDAAFAGAFGAAGASVVIEEKMEGGEVSFFALCDGVTAVPFGAAQDHKRAYDGDTGPNTGGMGAYSPAPAFTPALEAQVMADIITPTLRTMANRGTPYRGVLFAGLMLTKDGPKLIEYNCRFGDPECQVLMLRLETDLATLLLAAATGDLAGAPTPHFADRTALTVVMAAEGYPGTPLKGTLIRGLEAAASVPGVTLFHAGTARNAAGEITAAGGRVLNVCATAPTVATARASAYQAVAAIDWPQGFCRKDIAWRALAR